MSRLGDEIRKRMEDRESKEVMGAYIDALDHAEEPKLSTLTAKFSKLLGGDPEGENYFLEDPTRSGALERALRLEAGWLERERRVRVLLLDPALPDDVKDYLHAREHDDGAGSFACRELSPESLSPNASRDDVLERLRATAEREPSGLVVAASQEDRRYFAGAKLPWTLVRRVKRGFTLEAEPDLVPLPPPEPAPLFDETGEPLAPNEEFARLLREELNRTHEKSDRYGYQTQWHRCDVPSGCLFVSKDAYDEARKSLMVAEKDDHLPSFPVKTILSWRLRGAQIGAVDPAPDGSEPVLWLQVDHSSHRDLYNHREYDREHAAAVFRAIAGEANDTVIWTRPKRIFGVGALLAKIREELAPYHDVIEPPAVITWKEAIGSWNPWRAPVNETWSDGDRLVWQSSKRWEQLCNAVKEEAKLDITSTVCEWRKLVRNRRLRNGSRMRMANAEEQAHAHEALANLAARAWDAKGWTPALPLILNVASSAPLAVLPGHGENGALHVLADLGAGRILRIQMLDFPGEDTLPIRAPKGDQSSSSEFDGGDVHLWLEKLYDQALEGSTLRGRARRRQAEQDYYDSDDD